MAARGIKHTAEIALTPEPGPTTQEIEVLKAVVEEAAKVGVQVNVHAVSTPAMVAAIDAGVRRLVHLPNKDWTSREAAEKVASTGSIVLARPDRVRRANHRQRVSPAGTSYVPQRQLAPVPRRQAVARGDCRRQPRFER
jgi:imidazolonepropionase-like amidohydrolase